MRLSRLQSLPPHLPPPIIFGLQPRAFFRVASPLLGGLLTFLGAVLYAGGRKDAGFAALALGGAWGLVTAVGAAAREYDEAV